MNKKKILKILIILLSIALVFLGVVIYQKFFMQEVVEENPQEQETFEPERPPAEVDMTFFTQPDLSVEGELSDLVVELRTIPNLLKFINEINVKNIDLENESWVVGDLEELVASKSGGLVDVMAFSALILDSNLIEGGLFRYRFDGGENIVLVFQGESKPEYIFLDSDGTFKSEEYGLSFKDLISKEEKRLKVEIEEYGVLPPRYSDISEPVWLSID